MTRSSLGLLAVVALATSSLLTSSAEACVSICSGDPWQTPSLLTPEVPADLGPMVLAVRTCQTPALTDVALSLTGPKGAVLGTAKQVDQVDGIPGTGGSPSRHGRIIVGFVPDAALDVGASYTLTTTVGGTATATTFVASEPWGALVAPALAAPVVAKKVPTRVCCQGTGGCGGLSDPDPYPAPVPVTETVPPPPPSAQCATLSTVDEPETRVTFPLPSATKKIFFDYRLYDKSSGNELAYFSGRRLSAAEHDVRLSPGENRCFRLEMADILRGGKTSSETCTGAANVTPTVEKFCEGLDMYASCKTENATLIAATCTAGGAGGQTGEAGGQAGSTAGGAGGSPAAPAGGAAGQAGAPVGSAGKAGSSPAPNTGAGAGGTGSSPSTNAAAPSSDGCSMGTPRAASGGLFGVLLGMAALGAARRSRRTKDRATIAG